MEDQLSELIYIEISCQDKNGVLYQSCEDKIHANTEGALESWPGSGNPKPEYHYSDMETTLWNGRAQLIVRKEHAGDRVSVNISNGRENFILNV